MTPLEKARELLFKMNGQIIVKIDWDNASDYAKSDLKRKLFILTDELIKVMPSINGRPPNYQDENEFCREYWEKVKTEIEKL